MSTLAVITGASRGIGAGIADAAREAGAVVAACNRTPAPAEPEHELTADLSDPSAWSVFAAWYDALVEWLQPDRLVVVHNSATLTPIGFAGEVDPEAYQRLVLLDSAAPQVLGAAVLRTARSRKASTVLLQLSSGAAVSPYPGWTGYCAAKAAVEMWVQAAATELADDDPIRVAAIRPGIVATDMQAEIRSSEADAFPNVERFRDLHASGSLGDPADVGARIWRASLSDRWENGAVLDVNQPTWEDER